MTIKRTAVLLVLALIGWALAYPFGGYAVVPQGLAIMASNLNFPPAARSLARGVDARLFPGCGVGQERQIACRQFLEAALVRQPGLVSDLLKDRDAEVRTAAITTLNSALLKANEAEVMKLLGDPELTVRWHTAKRLFKEANPAHRGIWSAQLDNDSYVVRGYAVQALARMGVSPTKEMLAAVPQPAGELSADHRYGRRFFDDGLIIAGIDPYASTSP